MLKMKDKFRNLGPSGILYRFHPGGISLPQWNFPEGALLHPDGILTATSFHWAPIAGSTLRSDRRGKHFTPVPSPGATPVKCAALSLT